MSAADEEARAAAFREQGRRRIQNERARAQSLAGSRAAYDALQANWAAMRGWLTERHARTPEQPPTPDRPHAKGPHRGGPDGSI